MARVAIVFTGGTISMAFDPVAGGNVPALDGAAILARVPGLDAIASIITIDRGRTPASHFTFDDLLAIGRVVDETLADPAIDGLVVVQGTDTIEETAFAWDLLHRRAQPVVVTGAMRAADAPDADGPDNLRAAVTIAASPDARGLGVVVALGETVEPADTVQKTHTTALDTFASPGLSPLGRVEDTTLRLQRPRGPRRLLATDRAASRVQLVTAGIGTDGALLRAALAAGADGFVVAATGAGNTHPDLLAAATEAMAAGRPVVLASRCAAGAVGTEYAFPGGSATWVRAGAIPAGHLCAVKARIALAFGLGAGLDGDGLATLLADPLP
jgi:L-asparaginase